MRIAMASDHGGFELKEQLKEYLKGKGHEIVDLGTDGEASVDYPAYGKRCAEYVVGGGADKGIVVCGTGIGISIAANKVRGARCAVCASETMARLAANHNDANLLALGGRTTSFEEAAKYTEVWLSTPFDCGERHTRRVRAITEM
ncbi:MAG: ribose 5-phosphate isomerase B [Clostridiales Family XIII bacterium]|jgi:ribose 5-phosphate isomerase B|nr:ribose 5-phosphate isomerase B [Clostridiales Family XIII bacterium]